VDSRSGGDYVNSNSADKVIGPSTRHKSLLNELIAAHRTARLPPLVEALEACGLPVLGVPVWGVEFVELAGDYYQPRRGGHPAIIIPVFQDGELIDLTATGLATRRTVIRMGIASMLGQDAIDRATDDGTHLQVFSDPIEWLRNRCNGAVVLDWQAAGFALADVTAIACASELIAKKIDNAMRQPVRMPRLFVREETTHAAA
jgi:hypothetical protein